MTKFLFDCIIYLRYIIIVAHHMAAEQGRAPLDSVGTCLVHGLAGGNIICNLFFGQDPEMKIRHFREGLQLRAFGKGTVVCKDG